MSRGRRGALLLAALLAGRAVVGAQPAAPPLAVRQATPDPATDSLTIDGEHFGTAPFVTLDLVPLDLRLALDTRIMAAVPLEALPPGRYLLTVSRGPGASDRASIEVPLGLPPDDPPSTPPASPAVASQPYVVPAAGDVAAVVGERRITVAEADREWQATDPGGYVALMRELHEQRRKAADRLATSELLEREARARGVPPDALLADEVPRRAMALPDTAVAALYESLGERTRGASLERMTPALRAWLERKTEPELAKMAYVEELVKTSTRLDVVLSPPLVAVETSAFDPVRGAATAPVEIVMFGDLQSPDYARLALVTGRVIETFGTRVRLVFKVLPSFGTRSLSAAEAGACAHAQGRFWAFHDIAVRPGTLDARRLKAIPAEAGLDQAAFDRCLAAGQARQRIAAAPAEAARYGIASGPALVVNGRLAAPPPPFLPAFEYFTRLIEEELRRQAQAARKPAPEGAPPPIR